LVAHQTLSVSEIVSGRTYVNPSSDKSVNVNASTELGVREVTKPKIVKGKQLGKKFWNCLYIEI